MRAAEGKVPSATLRTRNVAATTQHEVALKVEP
jgi:hypothetical protein